MKKIKTGLYYVPHKDYLIYIRNCYTSILFNKSTMMTTSGVVADIETDNYKANGLIIENSEVMVWIGKV